MSEGATLRMLLGAVRRRGDADIGGARRLPGAPGPLGGGAGPLFERYGALGEGGGILGGGW
jgi:hypothetical protein